MIGCRWEPDCMPERGVAQEVGFARPQISKGNFIAWAVHHAREVLFC